jgi:hypothetical protein
LSESIIIYEGGDHFRFSSTSLICQRREDSLYKSNGEGTETKGVLIGGKKKWRILSYRLKHHWIIIIPEFCLQGLTRTVKYLRMANIIEHETL